MNLMQPWVCFGLHSTLHVNVALIGVLVYEDTYNYKSFPTARARSPLTTMRYALDVLDIINTKYAAEDQMAGVAGDTRGLTRLVVVCSRPISAAVQSELRTNICEVVSTPDLLQSVSGRDAGKFSGYEVGWYGRGRTETVGWKLNAHTKFLFFACVSAPVIFTQRVHKLTTNTPPTDARAYHTGGFHAGMDLGRGSSGF